VKAEEKRSFFLACPFAGHALPSASAAPALTNARRVTSAVMLSSLGHVLFGLELPDIGAGQDKNQHAISILYDIFYFELSLGAYPARPDA